MRYGGKWGNPFVVFFLASMCNGPIHRVCLLKKDFVPEGKGTLCQRSQGDGGTGHPLSKGLWDSEQHEAFLS